MESGKRHLLLVLMFLLSSFAAGVSFAGDWELFNVNDARTTIVDGVYVVDANISLSLNRHTTEALHSGVPLEIVFQVQVLRSRNWLWNETIAAIEKHFRLSYHALSERYLVRNLGTGASSSYSSLEEALFNLGAIRELPVVPEQDISPEQKYKVRLRATILKEALPAPIRFWSYVSSRWRVTSSWYTWPLNQ
jgi:hypothetical protein